MCSWGELILLDTFGSSGATYWLAYTFLLTWCVTVNLLDALLLERSFGFCEKPDDPLDMSVGGGGEVHQTNSAS